jgi:Rrf2 family protein
MLGKTSILAIRILISLGESPARLCVSPRSLAGILGESPTYLAKVCRLLVKAGILRARKGARGGVWLDRPAEEITLLSVVEACQGTLVGDYCSNSGKLEETCSFHCAAVELNEAITGVLSRWNLARLLERPHPAHGFSNGIDCVLTRRQTT